MVNKSNQEVETAIGCYGLLLACILGPIVMFVAGQITYEWLMRLAISNDIFIEPPPAEFGSAVQAEGVGQAMGLTVFFYGLLFLYLIFGVALGVFSTEQVARFSRFWSHRTMMPSLALTLLNSLTTLVGSSVMMTIIWTHEVYPRAQNPVPPGSSYDIAIRAAPLIGIALLSLNLCLLLLIRRVAQH
ncbi:MAG: hypothetical protein AAGA01_05245 [Cyanobacteria bacterium P01_E01_bin.43]